jgi:hypothetical protein
MEVQQSFKDGWEVVSDSFVDVEARTIQQLAAMREGKSNNRSMQLANRSSFATNGRGAASQGNMQNAAMNAVAMMQNQAMMGRPGMNKTRSGRWGNLQNAVMSGQVNGANQGGDMWRPGNMSVNTNMGLHLGGGNDFPGRIVPGQKFCIFSFPGEYEEDWKLITGGFVGNKGSSREGGSGRGGDNDQSSGSTAYYPQLSVACVFFPGELKDANSGAGIEGTGSHFYGKHGLHDVAGCHCAHIYAKHAHFKDWKDAKAPWGCLWFDSWMTCAKQAHALGQEAVVIYKRGMRGDDTNGLGLSGSAEVKWMKRHGIPIKHRWDIQHFQHFIKATEVAKPEGQKVWMEAEALAERDAKDPHMLQLQAAAAKDLNSAFGVAETLETPPLLSRRMSGGRRGSAETKAMLNEIPKEREAQGWLILMRHGESEGNINSQVYKDKPTHALELTVKGHEQACGAAAIIRDKFVGGHCHVYIR